MPRIKRMKITPVDDSTQIDIAVPEDRSNYSDAIIAKVMELFVLEPESKQQLIGIDMTAFVSQAVQVQMLIDLAEKGYSYQVIRWSGKTGQDTGVLVTKL